MELFKRLLIVICAIISVGSIKGQNVDIVSFNQLTNDISARVNEKNIGGEKCALVKVLFPVKGCEFVGTIEKPVFKVNEYWAYFKPGAQYMILRNSKFEPLRIVFGDISNISSLESGCTYQLKLSYKEDKSQATLILEISPKEIKQLSVNVDGEYYSVNNGTVIVPIERGFHNYTISSNGYEPVSERITISGNDVEKIKVELKKININGHEYVDLGLPSGLKWSPVNLGALEILDFGNYYAGGEINHKPKYLESNCITINFEKDFVNKSKQNKRNKKSKSASNINNGLNISGNEEYDAARAKWGASWRIPTKAEWEELINECSWKIVNIDGVPCYLITGPNGKRLVLPRAGTKSGAALNFVGDADYWSAEPSWDNNTNTPSGTAFRNKRMFGNWRYIGLPIRPVSD